MTDKEIQELKDYVDRCNKEMREYIDRQHKHMVDCLRKGIDAALLDQTYADAKKGLVVRYKIENEVKCYKCGKEVDWGGYGEPGALVDVCWKCHTHQEKEVKYGVQVKKA